MPDFPIPAHPGLDPPSYPGRGVLHWGLSVVHSWMRIRGPLSLGATCRPVYIAQHVDGRGDWDSIRMHPGHLLSRPALISTSSAHQLLFCRLVNHLRLRVSSRPSIAPSVPSICREEAHSAASGRLQPRHPPSLGVSPPPPLPCSPPSGHPDTLTNKLVRQYFFPLLEKIRIRVADVVARSVLRFHS
jgi:hypothetical protein